MNNSLLPLKSWSDNFIDSINKAKSGQSTSISYLRHDLTNLKKVSEGDRFMIIVMGGSVLTTSVMELKHGKHILLRQQKTGLPLMVSKEKLLETLEEYINSEIRLIVLNFAYPLTPIRRGDILDGILTKGTKNHDFHGLVGEKVGQTIQTYFSAKYGGEFECIVANDVVGLGLAAQRLLDNEHDYGMCAGIAGSGFNFGFFDDEQYLVNLECGNFNLFGQTESGQYVDSYSDNRGSQLLEKEIGGTYLYQHFNYVAEKENLIVRCRSTHELSQLATSPTPEGNNAKQIFINASLYITLVLYSLYRYNVEFLNRTHLFCLMEGSVYIKGYHVQEYVNENLQQLEIPPNAITIHTLEDSSRLGGVYLVS